MEFEKNNVRDKTNCELFAHPLILHKLTLENLFPLPSRVIYDDSILFYGDGIVTGNRLRG